MKKILLVFAILLPLLGFSQVDLASWAFTSNSNATTQSYVTSGFNNVQGSSITYSSLGMLSGAWGDSSFQTYRCYEVSITPTSGNAVYVTNLVFSQASIANGGNQGPTNYSVKYYVSDDGTFSDTKAVSLVTDESISANPTKNLTINRFVTSTQKLMVRFYARSGSWDNNAGWRINANTLKIKGNQVSSLSGTYYINSATLTPSFVSLTDAAKVVNSVGVSGPVTFLFDNANVTAATGETFPVVFNQFAGTSGTNTLTIKPNTGKTVTIQGTVTYNNGANVLNSELNALIKLNGADNIIFDGSNNGTTSRDLTIKNTSTDNYNNDGNVTSAMFWIGSNGTTDGALSNTIKNINLTGVNVDKTTSTSVGIMFSSSTGMTTDETVSNTGNTISNNLFTRMKYGVWARGNGTTYNQSLAIQGNTFGSATSTDVIVFDAIKLSNVQNVSVKGNSILGVSYPENSYTPSGILFVNKAINGVVENNKISNIRNSNGKATAIDVNIDANTSSNLSIYNNFISDVAVTNGGGSNETVNAGHGIYISNGKKINIYHNTVVMGTNENVASAALYIKAGTEFDIRNNIFANTQTTGKRFAIYSEVASSAFTSIDYNDYYATPQIGFLGGDKANLAAWQTATGKDTNSKSALPGFTSSTDFHLASPNATNSTLVGTSIAAVTKDIDGDSRSIPSMGADEMACSIQGDQTTYGNGSWIGYVYDNSTTTTSASYNPPPTTLFSSANYKGYVTEPVTFDRNVADGNFAGTTTVLCGNYNDRFAVRYKMTKNFTAGYYSFTVGGDDGYRLSIDGGSTYIITNYVDHSYVTSTSSTSYYLSGNVNLVLEYYENGSLSEVSFNYTACTSTSVAPTSITGTSPICANTTQTLTAVGGTLATGSSYQWGTGSVIGSNVISGQTGATISVNPTSTTTYWVRIYNTVACDSYTAGVTKTITMTTVPGDPTSYGDNVWNGYGYSNADLTLATTVYAGYYKQTTLGFTTQTTDPNGNGWPKTASPSSSNTWSGCPLAVDNFTLVMKRKGFPCGTYKISATEWDDDAEVYVNGVKQWSCTGYSGGSFVACNNGVVGTFFLDATSTIDVRLKENGGDALFTLVLAKTTTDPVAPTAITGNSGTCNGTAVTLTANGSLGTNGTYQWGTGTSVGNNILVSGLTTATYTVNPSSDTTYWVRIVESGTCGVTTGGPTFAVSVSYPATAGSLSSTSTTICKNTKPKDITLSGSVGDVKRWEYSNNVNFTAGTITNINVTSTVLSSNDMGALSETRYYRAVVKSNSCPEVFTTPIGIIVPASITYNNGWSSTPTETSDVLISSNLDLTTDLKVCSCELKNSSIVTVKNNETLTVTNSIIVPSTATLKVESGGSIVQINDTAVNSGNIIALRNSTTMKQYDYTYWASPVTGATFASFPGSNVYYEFNTAVNNWNTPSTSQLAQGKGYIVRKPVDASTLQTATFTGVPGNGVINVPIYQATAGTGSPTYNLIGNPYPSAIDADTFITANKDNISGTIYLWTHNLAISSNTPNPGSGTNAYSANDYAKYNLTGGTKGLSAASGGTVPNGKIASGQGFFIAAQGNAAGSKQLLFNNSMRIGGSGNNSQFFRTTPSAQALPNTIEKDRLWISVSNNNNAYDETLLGYITGATNDIDPGYDGAVFSGGNYVSIYTIQDDQKLSIQGRALPFDNTDVVPLGFSNTIGGAFKIAIENLDGLFTSDQQVFLEDRATGVVTNLKETGYTFETTAGTVNDRFFLKFTNGTLGTNNPDLNNNNVTIFKNGKKQIQVNSKDQNIQSVMIYDLLGRLVYQSNKINDNEFTSSELAIQDQVIIVKVKTDNAEITKKVIMN